jgi:hypothetical protein
MGPTNDTALNLKEAGVALAVDLLAWLKHEIEIKPSEN